MSSCAVVGLQQVQPLSRPPRLGTAPLVALLVAGQMLASLLFDQFGLFGLAQYPANLSRLLGAVFLVAGVVLIRL
jgi:bacterial/archaeal transporter family-2 protein